MSEARIVHLVDDDEEVRNALSSLLSMCGYTPHRHTSGRSFLDRLATGPLGVVLLDLRMPEMSGLEVQAELDRLGVELPIIFLTGHGDLPTGVQAMKRGAVDFLEKPVKDKPLLAALEQAFTRFDVRTEARVQARLARQLIGTLTPREREVMELVVQGLHNPAIGKQLGISLQTVKVHRMRAMGKLDVTTVPDLTRRWAAAASPDVSGDY